MMTRIQEIGTQHDTAIAHVIKTVGFEFGAIGDGFGPGDAEVNCMSSCYSLSSKSLYLVASIDHKIVGGCGIAALQGKDKTAELKKLFLLPEARGLGLGKKLANQCLTFAKQHGYEYCYLDTLKTMGAAITLYQKQGFKFIDKAMGDGTHSGCDVWMIKTL